MRNLCDEILGLISYVKHMILILNEKTLEILDEIMAIFWTKIERMGNHQFDRNQCILITLSNQKNEGRFEILKNLSNDENEFYKSILLFQQEHKPF